MLVRRICMYCKQHLIALKESLSKRLCNPERLFVSQFVIILRRKGDRHFIFFGGTITESGKLTVETGMVTVSKEMRPLILQDTETYCVCFTVPKNTMPEITGFTLNNQIYDCTDPLPDDIRSEHDMTEYLAELPEYQAYAKRFSNELYLRWVEDEIQTDGTLIIVPEEAEIVRMIFNDFLSGMGKNALANKLLAMGVPTKGGGVWTAWSIRRILKNEKYCGDLLLQKTYRENHITKRKMPNHGELPQYYVEEAHEGIIDKETFMRAQELLKAKKEYFSPDKPTTVTYPFSGMIHCGCCGKFYRRKVQPYRITWICWTYNARGKKYCPTSKQIPEDILYEKVCEVLQLDEFDDEVFQSEIEDILVPKANTLTFIFLDGHEQTVHWEDHSRSEAWTAEKKLQAAACGKKGAAARERRRKK